MKVSFIIFRLTAFLVCCLAGSGTYAQFGYGLKHYNVNNGLPNNSITAVSFAHSGYLWFGTIYGLTRYDGAKFVPYVLDSAGRQLTTSNYVTSLNDVPEDNVLLAITAEGSSFVIKEGKITPFFKRPDKTIEYTVVGKIPSLQRFRELQTRFKDTVAQGLPSDNNLTGSLIFINNADFLYYKNNQLSYYHDNIKQEALTLPSAFKTFCWKGKNVFMVDKDDRPWFFDNKNRKLVQVNNLPATKETPVNFFNDPLSGKLYYQSNTSFYELEYDEIKNEFKYSYLVNINDNRFIWNGLSFDPASSTLFLVTLNNGFAQVKLQKFTTINTNKLRDVPQDYPGDFVNIAVSKTNDSTAINPPGFEFATQGQGIRVRKLGNMVSERQTIGYLNNEIITTDDGKVYYYTPGDGYKMRHEFNPAFNLQADTKLSMLKAEGDSLWVITRNKIFSLTKNRFTRIAGFPMQQGTDNAYHSTITRLNPQEVLIGGITGLCKLQTIPPYKTDTIAALKNKWVRGVYQYKDYLLLAVYREGLYVGYKDQYYKVPLRKEEEALQLCHSTYIDKEGHMWVPTNRGLYMCSVEAVIESVLGKDKPPPYFFHFGQEDGIENIEFNGSGSPLYAVLKDERLFYPSMGGIVTFKPDELAIELSNHHVNIEKITLDNRPQNIVSDTIYLDAAVSVVTIQLNEPFFGNRINQDLEYNLDNTGWVRLAADDNQLISIPQLKAGKHSLQIRKRHGFGINDFTYRHLAIYKRKPFYEQVWFYLLIGVLLAGIIWLFLKIKTRNLENKRKALQQLVDKQTAELIKSVETKDLLINIITHDMVSPLRHIGFVSKVLSKGLEKNPERMTQSLNDIHSTSDKILSDSLSILNWMKYSNERIHIEKTPIMLREYVQELADAFLPIAKQKNAALLNKIPVEKVIMADRNILQTVLNNIISNSLKYATKGDVIISLADNVPGVTTLKISDTGIGMNEKILNSLRAVLQGGVGTLKENDMSSTGLGYVMMAQLIKIHGWNLWVDSAPGEGTVVSIEIKD